jgi:hypothetical protein
MDADWTAFDDRVPTWDDEDAAKPGETTGELTETADDGAEEVGLAD